MKDVLEYGEIRDYRMAKMYTARNAPNHRLGTLRGIHYKTTIVILRVQTPTYLIYFQGGAENNAVSPSDPYAPPTGDIRYSATQNSELTVYLTHLKPPVLRWVHK